MLIKYCCTLRTVRICVPKQGFHVSRMILDTKTAKEDELNIFIWPLYYTAVPVFTQTDEFEFTVPLISLPLDSFFSTALSESESN